MIENIYNIPAGVEVEKRVVEASDKSAEDMEDILTTDEVDHCDGNPEKVSVLINAKKAAVLNKFVQTRLAKIYQLSERASELLVKDIEAGGFDPRAIDGTSKILNAATMALTEINKFNMFLQQQLTKMII